jgi:hypothetical protein
MKRLTACLLLVFLAGATGADAWPSWPWSKKKKLPQPIDSPIVRPKNKSAIKSETMKHRSRYESNDWGREEKILNVKNPREGNHSIFVD